MIVTDLSNSFHPVPKQTSQKSSQKSSQIKKKSKKLAKLENNRFSIITNNLDKCYICKKAKKEDLHEVFGGRNRQTSMKYGLVIPVCRKCHQDKTILKWLKKFVQLKFEETHTREEFIKIFGKSYL